MDDYKDLINAATGYNFTAEEILSIGERIWNLERKFNLNAGISPAEDKLPDRFLNEPLPDGPQKDAVVHLDKILPEYYEIRGWSEKGILDENKVKELDL